MMLHAEQGVQRDDANRLTSIREDANEAGIGADQRGGGLIVNRADDVVGLDA
jgi:hypothetical protein